VSVQIQDSLGNNVLTSGVSIIMSLASGSGTLSGTTVQATDTLGEAAFADLSINLAGLKTLSASGSGLTPSASNPFTVSPGPATQLSVIQQPANTAAGTIITPTVTVRIRDAAGNNVASSGYRSSRLLWDPEP